MRKSGLVFELFENVRSDCLLRLRRFLRIGARCAEKEERAAREGGPRFTLLVTELLAYLSRDHYRSDDLRSGSYWKVCILERIKVAVIKVP